MADRITRERASNLDFRQKNQRITLRITDYHKQFDYDLILKPETYSLDRPARTTVVQTRGGAFIDNFGLGLGTLTISGTTGFRRMKNNSPYFNQENNAPLAEADGWDRWQGLVALFKTWYAWKETDLNERWWMHFFNWQENDQFLVWPTGLPKLTRSVREPVLFRYEIQFTVLRDLAKVSYDERAAQDTFADLGSRTDRAELIGLRIDEQVDNQARMVALITNNQTFAKFDPANPGIGDFTDVSQAQMDQYTQLWIDDLLRRQAPPTYVNPVDSQLGVVGRTRALADRIKDFAQGKTLKIDTTLGEVQATVKGWRDVLDAAEYAVNLPVVYAREARETLCAVQSLLLYPQLFRNSVSAALTELADLILDSGCATTLR